MFEEADKKINYSQKEENGNTVKNSDKKSNYSVDKDIKAKNDLISEGVKTAVASPPAAKEFNNRIDNLRAKGRRRGKRYSVIGISASIIISVGVLTGGYFLFNEITDITDEVGQKEEINEFASIIDPENICQGDNCCLASLEKIKKNNYAVIDIETDCAADYRENKLNCETSLVWCEKSEREICATKGEFVNPGNLKGKTGYPDVCCDGLVGVYGYRIDAGGICERIEESPYLTCIPCGDGICEEISPWLENKCNCPADCAQTATSSAMIDGERTIQDSDGDGLSDEEEILYGTDPDNPDTDGDGYLDGDEVKNGFNPAGEGVLENNNMELVK